MRSAQDDDFVGVLTKNMELRPGLSSAKPVQIRVEKRLGSATTLYGALALSFVIPSEPGFPPSQLSPVPLMWFSLKRTTRS
jgi:hypothetical protein